MSKYHFKSFSKVKLNNAQRLLTAHAEKVGIYENFGQEVISFLRDKYEYDPYSQEKKAKRIVRQIDALDDWCMNYSPQQ